MSNRGDRSPDEALGSEALEPWDEAIDAEARVTAVHLDDGDD